MKLLVKALLSLLVTLSVPVIAISGLAALRVVFPLIVISGSMEPEIHTGSLIVSTTVKAADLNVGDVASFKRADGILITHRIVSNEAFEGDRKIRSVRLKGDANKTEDKVSYIQSDALKPLFVIPGLGSALAVVESRKYEIIAVLNLAIGIYLIFKMISSVRKDRSIEGKRNAAPSGRKEGVCSDQK